MGAPPNMFNVKAQDITDGMIIFLSNDAYQEMHQYKVLSKSTKNDVVTLECFNQNLSLNETIMVNLKQQRDIFTSRLVSGWRKG